MSGIYLHIPFCRQACHYCNFHFSTSLKLKNEFVDALLKEISLQKNYLPPETVNTIYFGGGTPSLLTQSALSAILQALHQQFQVAANAEITLEANPDDITEHKLQEWKQAGVNRLSIGVQSFFEEDLRWMNRAHSAKQAIDNLQLAIQYFPNITIDLIYGGPTLPDDKWQHNVQQAIAIGVPHISCYALTVEPGTALASMINKHKTAEVNTEDQARQFLLLMDWLQQAGYEHYEISNFALPGMRSRHNSSYWQGASYLGLGPSAHSFNGTSRQWNIANNALYIQSLKENKVPLEMETLTHTQRLNEYTMTSLRTIEGLDLGWIVSRFGEREANQLQRAAQPFIDSGKMRFYNNHLQLTKEGKLFADGIAAALFV
ncbi:coproporphyrinogen III oxidase [Niastella koreensis]|uniref:Heme chaperone HemW n=2 Tax=Niastella koreensis TaxID=354356 RepID=G8TMQ0_NIAKG|nr:radical SAM family heme chaperone HemW [Niastella koreensis]AEW03071.1 oxygen-independent coproporphyrinogen III oxidase [Niastella koreensis GR20-10]OQP55384.1 coproporphyrinogen III oxidase [Niastella koreensis]